VAEIANQTWEANRYARAAGFVPVLGIPVVDLLAPQAGERILDLGCGDGVLSARIAEAGATVVAVDAAPDLIAAARRRGLDARLVDGQELPFANEFDAIFSNAIKFSSACLVLSSSAYSDGKSAGKSIVCTICPSCIRAPFSCSTDRITSRMSKTLSCNSSFPDPAFDKSRISLMILSKCVPLS